MYHRLSTFLMILRLVDKLMEETIVTLRAVLVEHSGERGMSKVRGGSVSQIGHV